MRKWLQQLVSRKKAVYQPFFRLEKTSPTANGVIDIYGNVVPDADNQFYPPKVEGISVFCPDSIANHYSELINKLADDVKIGSHRVDNNGIPLFKSRYLDVIMRLIEYIHMVPASESHHHSQAGGLLRHSIETAYLSMMQADEERPETSKFIDQDELRRPRYIYAAWVAGLLHDTGKVFTDMEVRALTVLDPITKQEQSAVSVYGDPPIWRPHLDSLVSWARQNKVTRYRVDYKKRKHQEHDQSSSILLTQILIGEGLEYIVDSPDDLYGLLAKTLTGYKTDTGYLAQMVRTGDSKSTARDIITINSKTFGQSGKSTSRIISEQTQMARANWDFNQVHGHCWVIAGEVFLRWSSAFNSIAEMARNNEVETLPSSARQLRSMMEDQLLTTPFEKEYNLIHFYPGNFTMERALRVVAGKEHDEMQWEQLVPVAYSSIVFGYDPIPGNAEGLILLTKADAPAKYMIVNREGTFTEVVVPQAKQKPKNASSKNRAATSKGTDAPSDLDARIESSTKNESLLCTKADATDSEPENKPQIKKKSGKKAATKTRKEPKSLSFINSNSESDSTAEAVEEGTSKRVSQNKTITVGQMDTQLDLDSAAHVELPETPDKSNSESQSDSVSIQSEQALSIMDVQLGVLKSKALLDISTTGVQTLDAEILGAHFKLTPSDIAAALNRLGILKRNYSIHTLEEYDRKGDKTQIVVRVKRDKCDFNENTTNQNLGTSKSSTNKPKKPKAKSSSDIEANPKTKKPALKAQNANEDTDNGLIMFAHRSSAGSLGFLINEAVVKPEHDGVIEQVKSNIRICIKALVEAGKAKGVPGHSNVEPNDVLAAILNYVEEKNIEHEIKIDPIKGALVTLPVKHIELMELPNVIK